MKLTVGSLFSGVGGFDKGLEDAGFEIKWQIERDLFARKVLAKHWPHVTCGDDVREWPGDRDESLDLLVGGFPCQDLSVAGKRAGLAGERSGLFHEFVRIAKTLKPTWSLVENVPGLFSSHAGRDMATVLEGLRECWPVVGYAVLDSQYFGVPQRRRRVFFVGGPTERGVEQVLFESQGGSGDFASSEEVGTDIAASLRSRSNRPGINPPGRGGEDDMNLVCQALTNLASGGPDDNEAQGGASHRSFHHDKIQRWRRRLRERDAALSDAVGRSSEARLFSACSRGHTVNIRRERRTTDTVRRSHGRSPSHADGV